MNGWSSFYLLSACILVEGGRQQTDVYIICQDMIDVCVLSRVWLFETPWTIACQALLPMEFFKQDYWSGLTFPPSEDLPDSGIEPTSPASPALSGEFFNMSQLGSPRRWGGCVCAKSLQSCLTLCNPMDCSPPDSFVHGILQAGILEWGAMPSSRDSPLPRDWTCSS